MYNREIKGHSLWTWVAAGVSAPLAQFAGSVPWHWTLGLAAVSGLIWVGVAWVTERGRKDWKPLLVLQLLFLMVAVAGAARWSRACWITAREGWAIPIVLLVLAACAAEGGCRAGARCGAVLFWFLVGLFLLLFAFAVPDVQGKWLWPENKGDGSMVAAILLVPAAGALLPRTQGKIPWIWAVGLGVTAVAISAVTAGVLTQGVAADTQGAFFEMVRGISILGVAERFEAVVSAAMTLGWFCLLSLLLTVAGHAAEKLHAGWGRGGVWSTAAISALLLPVSEGIPAWAMVIGAVMLWCVAPVLGSQKN